MCEGGRERKIETKTEKDRDLERERQRQRQRVKERGRVRQTWLNCDPCVLYVLSSLLTRLVAFCVCLSPFLSECFQTKEQI